MNNDLHTLSKHELEKIYVECGSVRKLARYFHISESKISNTLKNFEIKQSYKTRPRRDRKYKINLNIFKNLESPETLYWLGFILGDGFISKNYLEISLKDKEHVEKFVKFVGGEVPIYERIVKNSLRNKNWKDSKTYYVHVNSVDIIHDLQELGVTKNKSLRMNFPCYVIDNKYLNYFMLGYFDADGGYCESGKNFMLTLRGTKEFLEGYLNVLSENCSLVSINKKISFDSGIYRLQFNGINIASQISKYLYGNEQIIYLDRKYETAKKLII